MGGIQGGAFVYMLLMAALMVFFGIFSAGFRNRKRELKNTMKVDVIIPVYGPGNRLLELFDRWDARPYRWTG